MNATVFLALSFCAVLLAACGGTKKNTAAAAPASREEFDTSTGSWRPLSQVVTPPPHEEGAVIVAKKGPGMMSKVGKSLKKPLQWVGLAKDEPQSAPATSAPATVEKTGATQ